MHQWRSEIAPEILLPPCKFNIAFLLKLYNNDIHDMLSWEYKRGRGGFLYFSDQILGLGGSPATSPRKGITDATAIYQKGTLSRGRPPKTSIIRIVCKKINYRLIMPKLGNVMISKHAQDAAWGIPNFLL